MSLFANNDALTAVFAVTTAVVSALNAAWDPTERARKHRRAASDLMRLEGPLNDVCRAGWQSIQTRYVAVPGVDQKTGAQYDAGYYTDVDLAPAELKALAGRLIALEDDVRQAVEDAPPINRLFSHDPYAVPRTTWGLKRLERRLERQKQAMLLRERSMDIGPPNAPPPPPPLSAAGRADQDGHPPVRGHA
ncbi:hypothetical protein [uncultured Cellulomonas sp.]|uniref:hypothetical protein n=1 Tax=uncultured Cellulomonas sp. TaxID=189682 RepID=UPI00262D54D6|nr:hypothetical protein [uncultured Cellulomonas sp.]